MTEHAFDHKKLSNRILYALLLGLVFGLALNFTVAGQEWAQTWLINGVLKTVGDLFVRGLSMLVVPLVLVSLIAGVCSLSDPKRLGAIGGKAIGLYLLTTGIAISLALTAAVIFKPGVGANPEDLVERDIVEQPAFTEVLLEMVPRNPFAAMASDPIEMLPIIVFAVLIGLAIAFAGKPGERIGNWFTDMNAVVMRLVGIVLLLAPYGVFCLIAVLAATTGWGTFVGILKYVLLVLAVLVLHATVTYTLVLRGFAGLNPLTFFRKMRDVMMFAFSTASSAATIPVTLDTVENRLGADNRVASFTVPLGATINMDGTAIMQGIAVGFIAQFYGFDLSAAQYLMIILMVIMASIGAAGVPGVGLILLAGVLASVGLPPEQVSGGIAMIYGVDRLLDMTRTAVNVTGDATVTCIVANSEGQLDRDIFDNSGVERPLPNPPPQAGEG